MYLCLLSCIQREDDDTEKLSWLQKVHDPRVYTRRALQPLPYSTRGARKHSRHKALSIRRCCLFFHLHISCIKQSRLNYLLILIYHNRRLSINLYLRLCYIGRPILSFGTIRDPRFTLHKTELFYSELFCLLRNVFSAKGPHQIIARFRVH